MINMSNYPNQTKLQSESFLERTREREESEREREKKYW
jgi:hypothetical protein